MIGTGMRSSILRWWKRRRKWCQRLLTDLMIHFQLHILLINCNLVFQDHTHQGTCCHLQSKIPCQKWWVVHYHLQPDIFYQGLLPTVPVWLEICIICHCLNIFVWELIVLLNGICNLFKACVTCWTMHGVRDLLIPFLIVVYSADTQCMQGQWVCTQWGSLLMGWQCLGHLLDVRVLHFFRPHQ